MTTPSAVGARTWLWRDGTISEAQDPTWSGLDRAALYGDGLFETIRVAAGRAIELAAHLERLHRSARTLGFPGIDEVEVDTNFGNHSIQGDQPRTAIGVVEDNQLLVVVVDGRSPGYSAGATLTELATWMKGLGAVTAYNIDGGGSSTFYFDGEVRGWVTSGGYAHAAGLSVAIGYVPKEIADVTAGWSIELLGEVLPARLQAEPLFDPSGAKMRG